MMRFSKNLKTTALAGLFGLGVAAATTGPAVAHQAYTRCDRDGDHCVRVICDDDGDRCRTYNTSYYGYDNNYYNRYYNRYRYDRGYYNSGYRHWVCDSDGDRCHWSYDRW
jgi:hypothetical protein